MKHKTRSSCPICFSLELFGDKWSLLILRDIILFDKKHYHEFMDSSEGISTNILADRLQKLECAGLIKKKQNEENQKKFIYAPTDEALDLLPLLIEMTLWGVKHNPEIDASQAPPEFIKKMIKDRKRFIKNIRIKFK
ncbi:MAG: transcriptional regulator [Bdellovibrionales bacterium CG10_big_fil_rev_8_21_14_0_10_45_34]|nr:MAG: transcriptional regulator [Bdellovibrionales bacterium CG10_big_fil_rev_8_21_14_0_10_45_34]